MPSPVVLMRAIQEGLLSAAPRERMEALLFLLALPDAGQARMLLADHAARDSDAAVRELAGGCSMLLEERIGSAHASAIQPPKKLTTKFRDLVSDSRPAIRLSALAKVLRYKGGILVELVEEAMAREEEPSVLAAMVAVLAQRGSVGHLGTLARLVDHEEPIVGEQAVHALAQLGGGAVRPLLTIVAEGSRGRVAQAAGLELLALDPDEPAAPARPLAVRELAARLTSPDPAVRLAAVEAARGQLDSAEIHGLVEVLSELDAEQPVAMAARRLLDVQEAQVLSEVPTGMLSTPDLERSWAKLPPRQLAEKRLRTALALPDETARSAALAHLRDHPVKSLLPVLLEKMEDENSPAVLAQMIALAGRLGAEAEVPRLARYLRHGNPAVVRAALIALWRLGGEEMVPLFLTLLARPDERVQDVALAALSRLGPDKLLAYVITMARSSRDEARHRALGLLERVPTPALEDVVIDMLARENSDRLTAREFDLIAKHASPRSITALWVIRRRRPSLGGAFTDLLARLSDRWGLPVDAIRLEGEQYLEAHPELLVAPEKPDEKPAKKRAIFSMPEEIHRGWVYAGGLALAVMTAYQLDFAGLKSGGSGLSPDQEAAVIERVQSFANEPPRPLPDLPDGVALAERLEEIAATYGQTLPDPAAPTVLELERARYRAMGFTNDAYIDMEARGQLREAAGKAIADARERVKKGDPEAAVVMLERALARIEAENLILREALSRELARTLIAAKQVDRARTIARAALDLARKVVSVRRATARPGGTGQMASAEDEAAIEKSAKDMDVAFDEATKRIEATGQALGLLPEEVAESRALLDQLKNEGKISSEEYQQGIATLAKAGKK